MGQTVRVENGVTVFDNSDPSFNFTSLGPANVGNVVEVSGNDMPDGSIQATFIERKANDLASFIAANGELELKGSIANLTASTFTIGSLTIDYATASLFDLDNSPSNQLENGLPVEVKGTQLAGNVFTAATVEVKLAGLGLDNIAKAEVEGFITELNTSTETFVVNGQRVNYANAAFRAGLVDELANGVKVETEGPMAGGVINATRVTFKESIRFEANVATVSGNSVTLQGSAGDHHSGRLRHHPNAEYNRAVESVSRQQSARARPTGGQQRQYGRHPPRTERRGSGNQTDRPGTGGQLRQRRRYGDPAGQPGHGGHDDNSKR